MTGFRIIYEGPASLAVTAAAALADADGVELTSSEPPRRTDSGGDVVVLALTVEGAADTVLDAVAEVRDQLGPSARVDIAEGDGGRS